MAKIACPQCQLPDSQVRDSRPNHLGIYRRRVCKAGHRFTTQEITHGNLRKIRDQITQAVDLLEDCF